jgi:hypothetical protein
MDEERPASSRSTTESRLSISDQEEIFGPQLVAVAAGGHRHGAVEGL